MTRHFAADELVQFQSNNLNIFRKSLVTSVVCEFRFPTLIELGDAKPPARFVKALRKKYPHIETATDVSFGFGGSSESSHSHIFRALRGGWSVSLKHSSLTIETNTYTGYEELLDRALEAVEAAEPIIDADFWTRIGLRYVNHLPGRYDPIRNKWINPALTAQFADGIFRGVNEFATRLLLNAEDGGCLLQTSLKRNPKNGEVFVPPDFVVDVDAFRNEVALSDSKSTLDAMHAQAFNCFDWSLGDAAREHLAGNNGER